MIDLDEQLIEYQEKTYGSFETMNKENYEKKKKEVKKPRNIKNHPEVEDFWEWFLGPAARRDKYLETVESNRKSLTTNKEYSNNDGFTPKVCLKCSRVWDREIAGRNMKLEYYKDFPTYGVQRKNCPPCNRKEKNGKAI